MLKVAGGGGGAAGAVSYQGTWNASTNTPTLVSSVGTKGEYYVVSVSGSTNLNGITDWVAGDWAIFNGTAWEKVDNTESVISVNGQQGVVVLNAADVGAVANTTFVNATGLLTGGGQLTGNVAIDLTNVPIANVTGGVANTVEIIAGTGLTGGGNLSANVSIALANTAVSPATYGGGSNAAEVTIDAQGRITAAANVAIPQGTVTNIATGTGLDGGPITGTGTISLANTTVVAGTYGSGSLVPQIVIDAQGRITSASNVAVAGAPTVVTNVVTISAGTAVVWQNNAPATITWENNTPATIDWLKRHFCNYGKQRNNSC
jgi:trimeric autotransporter adhesin